MKNDRDTGEVIFSFSNEKETWRMVRMMKVYSFIDEESRGLILKMHDHKGELTVTAKEVTQDLTYMVTQLWEVQGEPYSKVIPVGSPF